MAAAAAVAAAAAAARAPVIVFIAYQSMPLSDPSNNQPIAVYDVSDTDMAVSAFEAEGACTSTRCPLSDTGCRGPVTVGRSCLDGHPPLSMVSSGSQRHLSLLGHHCVAFWGAGREVSVTFAQEVPPQTVLRALPVPQLQPHQQLQYLQVLQQRQQRQEDHVIYFGCTVGLASDSSSDWPAI